LCANQRCGCAAEVSIKQAVLAQGTLHHRTKQQPRHKSCLNPSQLVGSLGLRAKQGSGGATGISIKQAVLAQSTLHTMTRTAAAATAAAAARQQQQPMTLFQGHQNW
jgi:hypothetical protein